MELIEQYGERTKRKSLYEKLKTDYDKAHKICDKVTKQSDKLTYYSGEEEFIPEPEETDVTELDLVSESDEEHQNNNKDFEERFDDHSKKTIIREHDESSLRIDEVVSLIDNNELLKFFKTNKKLSKRLKSVFEGEFESARHDYLVSGKTDFSTSSNLVRELTNVAFLRDIDRIDEKLKETCQKHYDKLPDSELKSRDSNYNNFRNNYVKYVMIQEGILLYLTNLKDIKPQLTYNEAFQIYHSHKDDFEQEQTKTEYYDSPSPSYSDHEKEDFLDGDGEDEDEIPDLD